MAKEVSQRLANNSMEIANMLLPGGKKQGNEWCAGDVSGSSGDSLKVHLTGVKSGVWCDFATGEGGDLLDLWSLNRSVPLNVALKQACDYLGIKNPQGYNEKKPAFKKPRTQFCKMEKLSPVMIYLENERKLTSHTIAKFNVTEHKGSITFPSYRDNELISVKYMKIDRPDGKKLMYVEKDCEPGLFGWQSFPKGSRKLVLCEGEIDAMSMSQYGQPALSVPFGAGTGRKHEWIEYEFDRLALFDEIYLCMDNDSEGKKAAEDLVERLGSHRCKIVELPMKDVNECLINGVSADDIAYCLKIARSIDPEELRYGCDFTEEAYEIINPTPGKFRGYTLGWSKTSECILFKPSGLSMWTGYNGHGKTMFLGMIMINMMKQGARVCVASMEMLPAELMARTYLQCTGRSNPSFQYLKAVDEWIKGKLFIFDLVGTAKITRLLDVFLYARRKYGVDVFIVDSLTTLNIAEDDYNGQKQLTEMLRDFKIMHNCHIHLVAHPRKPRDESEIPGKYDIRGGGAISDLADNCFSVWRNKKKEELSRKMARGDHMSSEECDNLLKGDTYLKCDKNRHGVGKFKEGVFSFWFDEQSNQYREVESNKIKPIIEYSCLD